MSITVRNLKHVAETVLGCELEPGKDHVRYVLRVSGRVVGRFMFSHSWRGNQQIHDEILHRQARTMKCSDKTWKLLLEGKLPKEAYFEELLKRKEINQAEYDFLCKKEASVKDIPDKRTKSD